MAEADGQATEAPQTSPTTSTASAPAPESQSTSPQTSVKAPDAVETFFDPESIKGKPELELAYKQMQGEFTRRTTAFKGNEQKIKAYDMFLSNPAAALQELATQYGFKLSKAEAQAIAKEQASQFEPQSWDEVISRTKQEAKQEILKDLAPFLNQVKETRQSQVEKILDEKCPDWRVYETKMQEMLDKHPTMAYDPLELYRVSVPAEVWTSRATQAALKKLQDKAESSQLSGGSTTNQQASDKPNVRGFNDAVEYAKKKLASQGIRAPNLN